jgi:hypothetical protein
VLGEEGGSGRRGEERESGREGGEKREVRKANGGAYHFDPLKIQIPLEYHHLIPGRYSHCCKY